MSLLWTAASVLVQRVLVPVLSGLATLLVLALAIGAATRYIEETAERLPSAERDAALYGADAAPATLASSALPLAAASLTSTALPLPAALEAWRGMHASVHTSAVEERVSMSRGMYLFTLCAAGTAVWSASAGLPEPLRMLARVIKFWMLHITTYMWHVPVWSGLRPWLGSIADVSPHAHTHAHEAAHALTWPSTWSEWMDMAWVYNLWDACASVLQELSPPAALFADNHTHTHTHTDAHKSAAEDAYEDDAMHAWSAALLRTFPVDERVWQSALRAAVLSLVFVCVCVCVIAAMRAGTRLGAPARTRARSGDEAVENDESAVAMLPDELDAQSEVVRDIDACVRAITAAAGELVAEENARVRAAVFNLPRGVHVEVQRLSMPEPATTDALRAAPSLRSPSGSVASGPSTRPEVHVYSARRDAASVPGNGLETVSPSRSSVDDAASDAAYSLALSAAGSIAASVRAQTRARTLAMLRDTAAEFGLHPEDPRAAAILEPVLHALRHGT